MWTTMQNCFIFNYILVSIDLINVHCSSVLLFCSFAVIIIFNKRLHLIQINGLMGVNYRQSAILLLKY